MYCVGFLDSFSVTLRKVSEYFDAVFGDKTLTDEETVRKYLGISLFLAPRACLPENVTPRILAIVLLKYGRDHPRELTDDMYHFAGRAFSSTYSCPKFLKK
jgi:hypothetical protein